MVDVTFRKIRLSLGFVLFICSFILNAQNKINSFSTDFGIFVNELNDFMNSSDNSELKETYKSFKKLSNNSFSEKQKENIIKISNLMLKKRLRAKPHFNQFLLSLNTLKKQSLDNNFIDDWLLINYKVLNDFSTKKLLMFFYFTIDLVENNVLRSSKTTKWSISNSNYHFAIDNDGPYVVFPSNLTLTCFSNGGTLNLYNTKGSYYPIINEWIGFGGNMNWEKKLISADSIFVNIKKYKIDTRTTVIKADSVSFINKKMFNRPIAGVFIDKISKGKQINNYPKFTSYRKDIIIKDIYPNVDYKGGYKLQGKEFIADGGDYAQARIIFNKNGKTVFVANANKFILGGDNIKSSNVGIKIFFDQDSLYHSNLKFSYDNINRKLQLISNSNESSGAPMLNTYHQLNMNFELLQWNIDENIMTFGSLPGTSESIINFESVDMYLERRFDQLQGIDQIHPLILVMNYMEAKNENQFFVEDFAKYARFPLVQIQHFLMDLANKGFLFYDFSEEKISVLPSLKRYVLAKSKQGDYDVLQFKSQIKSSSNLIVNAALDIISKDLIIRGINRISVSDSQKVIFYPYGGEIKILKDRDFIFNGRILAGNGRVNLYGKDFNFKYQDFKVDLQQIDSVQLSVPIQPIELDMYNNQKLTRVKTVIEAGTGELVIDDASNKSGLRKEVFPNYPIFKSYNDSYVYYDQPSVYGGVYNRENFSFHILPFEIDSVESYTGKGLWFAGTFESSGIFPVFDDTLRMQDDYSLGFTREAPKSGFDIYNGTAKYFKTINLSHKGLKGFGKLEYLTSILYVKEMIFFPDSSNILANSFVLEKVTKGIEFPSVRNTSSYAHFRPYNNNMRISSLGNKFNFYDSIANFEGDITLQPIGLTGKGKMTLDLSEISSELFSYNSDWFKADKADLNVFEKSGDLAFLAKDLRTNIDLSTRTGLFYSNGSSSYVTLPANNFICYIDKLEWNMDKQKLNLSQSEESANSGSRFVSIDPKQDSLSFTAKYANYSLTDNIIYSSGVDSLLVADAIIYPDSGLLTVRKNAEISPIYNSLLIADNLTRYHTFSNATIKINSANNFQASGDYIYINALDKKQKVFFKNLSINEDTITYGIADVKGSDLFQIDETFDFKGSLNLNGDRKELEFDGFFRINHNCNNFSKEWIKFKSFVDPFNISFNLDSVIYNDNQQKLSTGIMMSLDSTKIYSTFLSIKDRAIDPSLIKSSSKVSYNANTSEFIVGLNDSTENYFILNNKSCETYGAGEIDLNIDLGRVDVKSIGVLSNLKENTLQEFSGFFMLDFLFSKKAIQVMADDIFSAPGDDIFEYTNLYKNNLLYLVGSEQKEELMIDLEMNDEYSKLPEEMLFTLSFSDITFKWNNMKKAYVSVGDIGLGNILNNQIHGVMDGYILIEKGRNSDILTIYLQTEFYDEYYFVYNNGLMRSVSTNPDFNLAISDVNDNKRKAPQERGKKPYRYMLAQEDAPEKFVKRIKKEF